MTADLTVVALDANVLAKPVTRTLLLVGGLPSGFRATWSNTAEREAERHMRPGAVFPSVVRERFGIALAATGQNAGRFAGTSESDRQVLADAAAAGAKFLITEDVDDFALGDLAGVGISAVSPDLFLAERLTRRAYVTVIDLFVERQVNPPTTPALFHAMVARKHPRLFAVHGSYVLAERVQQLRQWHAKRPSDPPPGFEAAAGRWSGWTPGTWAPCLDGHERRSAHAGNLRKLVIGPAASGAQAAQT